MTTLAYWHKLLKKANIETHEVERITMDRAKWENVVKDRRRHIEECEKQQGHQYRRHEDEKRIERRSQYEIQNDTKCKYEGCSRTFRTTTTPEEASQNNKKFDSFYMPQMH